MHFFLYQSVDKKKKKNAYHLNNKYLRKIKNC